HGRTIDDMFTGLTFARDLRLDSGDRGRWYVSAGFANPASYGKTFSQPALKAGVKFELKDWGYLDLYAFYSQEVGRK
ncbi:MAG: hypothetical protein ACXWC9_01885, partial [Pseudobdellovibrionaceae bacterium]